MFWSKKNKQIINDLPPVIDQPNNTDNSISLIFKEAIAEVAKENANIFATFSDQKLKELFKLTFIFMLKNKDNEETSSLLSNNDLKLSNSHFEIYCKIFIKVAKALNIKTTYSAYLHIDKASFFKVMEEFNPDPVDIDEAARKLLSVGVYR